MNNRSEIETAIENVRNAYKLLADYQQRLWELLNFIRKNFGATSYYYGAPHWTNTQLIHNLYEDNNAGRNTLPMTSLNLLWYKADNGVNWQKESAVGDMVFNIFLPSDLVDKDSKDAKANKDGKFGQIHLYIYYCIKPYQQKVDWCRDVWYKSDYPDFSKIGRFPTNAADDDLIYKIYGEAFDLAELTNEEAVINKLQTFCDNFNNLAEPIKPLSLAP